MKQLKAFLLAVLLSVITIIGIHLYGKTHISFDHHQYGTWTEDAKFLSREGVLKNLDANSMIIFGSSEFRNATDSPFHIKNFFTENAFTPVLIGRDQYQCLHHAIALASIGNTLENKKVVLILSPQWFQREHVIKESFALRFAESHYLAMLQNDQLSDTLKEHLIARTTTLLSSADDTMLKRVALYNRIYFTGEASLSDRVENVIYQSFGGEKDMLRVVTQASAAHLSHEQQESKTAKNYDWSSLYLEAEYEAASMSANPLYESQTFYEKNIKLIAANKDTDTEKHYFENADEYGDLTLFLEVCKELEIKPLIIILPNNGYWLDHTGYPKEEREKTYAAMKNTAESYDVQIEDLTGLESEPFLFTDNYHFSGKGWVLLNEAIYEFYQQDEAASKN